jgi:hypothetical protein
VYLTRSSSSTDFEPVLKEKEKGKETEAQKEISRTGIESVPKGKVTGSSNATVGTSKFGTS